MKLIELIKKLQDFERGCANKDSEVKVSIWQADGCSTREIVSVFATKSPRDGCLTVELEVQLN